MESDLAWINRMAEMRPGTALHSSDWHKLFNLAQHPADLRPDMPNGRHTMEHDLFLELIDTARMHLSKQAD